MFAGSGFGGLPAFVVGLGGAGFRARACSGCRLAWCVRMIAIRFRTSSSSRAPICARKSSLIGLSGQRKPADNKVQKFITWIVRFSYDFVIAHENYLATAPPAAIISATVTSGARLPVLPILHLKSPECRACIRSLAN